MPSAEHVTLDQDCSKQFGSGTAILCSDNKHTHLCTFSSSSSHKCGTAMAVPALWAAMGLWIYKPQSKQEENLAPAPFQFCCYIYAALDRFITLTTKCIALSLHKPQP